MADSKNRQRQGSISSAEAVNSRSAYQLRSRNNEFTASGRMPVTCDREWALIRNLRDYFLPVFFFAAQYAFNFADNFARVAVLIMVFLAAGLAETVAGFELRTFAHLAL